LNFTKSRFNCTDIFNPEKGIKIFLILQLLQMHQVVPDFLYLSGKSGHGIDSNRNYPLTNLSRLSQHKKVASSSLEILFTRGGVFGTTPRKGAFQV
jgi:hypothetical protein